MSGAMTVDAPDAVLADALRASPGLVVRLQQEAEFARRQTGMRSDCHADVRPFVEQAWTLATWVPGRAENDVTRLRRWLRAKETMQAITGLTDLHARALSTNPGAMMPTSSGAAVQRMLEDARRAALASHPALAALAGIEGERQAVELAQNAVANAAAVDAYRRAQPGVLLARLRAAGIEPLLYDGRVCVPVGTSLTAADRAEMVDHRDGLLALLTPVAVA